MIFVRHVACMRNVGSAYILFFAKLKGKRDNLQDWDVDGRMRIIFSLKMRVRKCELNSPGSESRVILGALVNTAMKFCVPYRLQ
jgi:hypothetical protein